MKLCDKEAKCAYLKLCTLSIISSVLFNTKYHVMLLLPFFFNKKLKPEFVYYYFILLLYTENVHLSFNSQLHIFKVCYIQPLYAQEILVHVH